MRLSYYQNFIDFIFNTVYVIDNAAVVCKARKGAMIRGSASLTGTVASHKVPEASKGVLTGDGDPVRSIKNIYIILLFLDYL